MKSSSVEQLILDLFSEEHAHLTAQEVYNYLRPRLPAVNPSTVYRALERMTHAGKVSVSDMWGGATVFEVVGEEHHHHLVCENCHRTITLRDETVKSLFDNLSQEYNFEMTTNHLILFGHCKKCLDL